jgi:hypothetical protein
MWFRKVGKCADMEIFALGKTGDPFGKGSSRAEC